MRTVRSGAAGRARAAAAAALSCAVAVVLLPPPSAAAAGRTPMTSASSGRCLDVRDDALTGGAPTIVWDCHGGRNQAWSQDSAGRLRTLDGALCLEPSSPSRGAAAGTATCSSGAGQRWRVTPQGAVVHVESGLCLDVQSGGPDRGTPVIVWDCHGGLNQQWSAPGTDSDTSAPSAPGGLSASALTCEDVVLSWTAASDDVAVTAYDLFHDGQLVRSLPGADLQTSVRVVAGVTWGWYVNARDAAGNVSQASATVAVTPSACSVDTTAPTVPTDVSAQASGTTVVVQWTASSDDEGVRAYDVLRDGRVVTTVSAAGSAPAPTSWSDSGLAAGRTYEYRVVARDAQGNASTASAPVQVQVTTGAACASSVCGTREVARDTDVPWGLVTLPDGTVLYSRRDAHDVVALDPVTGATRRVGVVPGVSGSDGEGGLMGLAVAPTFAADPWVYAMHTSASDNRVVRLRYTDGELDTSSTQVLLSGILRNKYHNGGRLRFGPDGMLYVATGDAQNGDYSQALSGLGALNGKVLRMTPTGGVPDDNPFGNLIWSYGHRNPQGLAFDAQGRLWQQEFGNGQMDETNLVRSGGNYGWPQCEGTVSTSAGGCDAPGLVAPAMTYPTADGSCSGLAVQAGALWVACARGARLYRHVLRGDRLTDNEQHLVGTYGRLRTVEPAADGGLWVTTTRRGEKDSIPDNSDERLLHVTLGG